MSYYLDEGLPAPAPDALDAPFWEGLTQEKICLQYCDHCNHFQWGPEWICHRCHGESLTFRDVDHPQGVIYSYERSWHPVHPSLNEQGPYLVVLIEVPSADNVRLIGNLLGDPRQEVKIGAAVSPVFEHHTASDPAFTLLQWQTGD